MPALIAFFLLLCSAIVCTDWSEKTALDYQSSDMYVVMIKADTHSDEPEHEKM